MEEINLTSITNEVMGESIPEDPIVFAKTCMRIAIHQALILASNKVKHVDKISTKEYIPPFTIDKKTILNIEDLVKD